MKRVSRNLFAIVGSDMGRRLIGFFTIAYLARKLGTGEFGVINIGFTVLSYAIMASAGGLATFGAREVAKGSTDVVNTILSLRIVTLCAAYLIVAVIAFTAISDPLLTNVILIACIALFANALLLEWFFQGREAMGMIGVGRLTSAAIYFLLVIFLVHGPQDVLWVAVAAVAGDVVSSVVSLAVYRKRYFTPFRFQIRGGIEMFRQSFRIGIGSILGHFSLNLPPIVIGIMLSTSDAGIYSAAQKLVFFLLLFDRVLGTLLLPAAARFISSSTEKLAANLSFALRWAFIFALPVALGGTLLAERIIPLVFGSQYLAAVPVFRILIWYFFFTLLHTIYTSGLIAIGEEKRFSRIMIMSSAVYGLAVILGTKMFGLPGAAAGVAGAEALTLVLMRYEFKKFVRTTLRSALLPVAVASVVMCTVLMFIPAVHVVIAIAVGGVIYTGSLFLLKGLTVHDVTELLGKVA
jgi:O-antigen/teichoic acid export membrane protein